MIPNLRPEEPAAGPFTAMTLSELAAEILRLAGEASGRPHIIAINGRSGSGKSTLARRLADEIPHAAVIGTDDLCWWEPMFEWAHVPADYVLEPLHRGQSVSFTPPAWTEHGREGRIEVPSGTQTLILEGVGADQQPYTHLVDAVAWVQSDYAEAERRGLARDVESGENGDAEESAAFWFEWQRHENHFFAEDRPWERAGLVVAGTETIPLEPGQIAVAPAFPSS